MSNVEAEVLGIVGETENQSVRMNANSLWLFTRSRRTDTDVGSGILLGTETCDENGESVRAHIRSQHFACRRDIEYTRKLCPKFHYCQNNNLAEERQYMVAHRLLT